jgi:hypothetical protein
LINLYNKALTLDPILIRAWFNLGNALDLLILSINKTDLYNANQIEAKFQFLSDKQEFDTSLLNVFNLEYLYTYSRYPTMIQLFSTTNALYCQWNNELWLLDFDFANPIKVNEGLVFKNASDIQTAFNESYYILGWRDKSEI